MASVPTWQPSVAIQQAPSVRVSAPMGDAGAPVFAGIDKNIQVQLKQKADEDSFAALDASNKMTTDMLNFVNGENGVLFKKGENAVGVLKQTEDFYNQKMQEYSNILGNNVQRRMFEAHSRPNMYNFMRNVATHEKNEAIGLRAKQYDTSINTGSDIIAANYHDPKTIKAALGTMDSSLLTQATGEGWTKDIVNERRQKNNTTAIMGAFNVAMDNNDTTSAKKLIDNFGNLMDPVMRGKATLLLNKIQHKNDDFLAADGIVKQATRADGSIDLAVAQNLLSKMYGPDKTSGGSISAGLDAGWKAWGNQHMDNGRVGCAEAVGKIGGYYSPFLAQEAQAGIAYVPTMVQHASQPGGPGVIPFDASKLQKGDCIVYGDDDHIVIADGNGGYVGNSSDANGGQGATVHGNDYTAMSGLEPTKIIKTGGDDSSAAFDAGRYKQVEGLVHAKISDNMRIKAQQDRDYRQQLSQQIDGAGSLSDAMDVINGADLPLQTKNALIGAAKTKFKALTTGDPNQKFFANYERNGLYRDMNVIAEQQAMIEEGRDPTPAQSTKFSNAWYRVNRYNAFTKGGGYGGGGGDADVAKSRYQEIMQDLWNSKTPEERKQKVRDNMAELNDLEQQLGVDANNDVSYIMSNGEG